MTVVSTPLADRVHEGIPRCQWCGRMLLDVKRMSRQMVRVSPTRVEILYRHQPGECEKGRLYREQRQEGHTS